MMRFFDTALSKLTRAQSLDDLAAMGMLALDAASVLIVDLDPVPTLIGASGGADAVPDEVVAAARDMPLIDPAVLVDRVQQMVGSPLDFPPPHASVIAFSLFGAAREVRCLVFPADEPVLPARLSRFASIVTQQLSKMALLKRYRGDLKHYISVLEFMERVAMIGLWEYYPETRTVLFSDETSRLLCRAPGTPRTIEDALNGFPDTERDRLIQLVEAAERTGTRFDVTLPFVRGDGDRRTIRVIASTAWLASGENGVTGVMQDVTVAHEANQQLWWAANHDVLTGLPNRALFAERFASALERGRRTQKLVCVVHVDVDKFKEINDTLGHAAGDRVLCCVADAMKASVRQTDTVARTGGDEFSILLVDVDGPEGLQAALDRLRHSLEVRLSLEDVRRTVVLSAGAAVAPHHGSGETELNVAADLALYRMKREPGGALALFCPSMRQEQEETNRLIGEVNEALAAGRIVPYYQPQVDIATGRIVGVEALARWETDDGVLTAADFAPALSDPEVGPRIGLTVVDRAIAEVAMLNRRRSERIALAINASASELTRATFLDRIGKLWRAQETATGSLTVEIAKDVVLDDVDGELGRQMQKARERGVSFSLDDFGNGYDSLINVSALPISELKVDRRFVADMVHDTSKQTIIAGIIEVARSLGLRLIVEGVETAEQVRCITRLGGRLVQGFYYSRAVPLSELETLLDERCDRDPVSTRALPAPDAHARDCHARSAAE